MAVEQRDAELLLQRSNRLAQGGLRDMHGLGCGQHGVVLHARHEIAEKSGVHVLLPSRAALLDMRFAAPNL